MFGKEDSMLFNSGYSANVGILSAICRKGDIVFYDQLSHASIQDALLMVKASGGNVSRLSTTIWNTLKNYLLNTDLIIKDA